MNRTTVVPLLPLLLLSCDFAGDPAQPDPHGPAALVHAAAPDAEHAWFLPPLFAPTEPRGPFDDTLLPHLVFEVCEWRDGGCGDAVARFTAKEGSSDRIRMDADDEHYIANWRTSGSRLEAGRMYRVRVLAAGAEVTHADILAIRTNRDRDSAPPGAAAVVIGRTVPLKVRIEQGAVHIGWIAVADLPGSEAVVRLASPLGDVMSPDGDDERGVGVALPERGEAVVFALDHNGLPLLAGWASPGDEVVLDLESTAHVITSMTVALLVDDPERTLDHVQGAVAGHELVGDLVQVLGEGLESGESFSTSEPAAAIAVDVLADVWPDIGMAEPSARLLAQSDPALAGSASAAGALPSPLQIPVIVNDGPVTTLWVCNNTWLHLEVRNASALGQPGSTQRIQPNTWENIGSEAICAPLPGVQGRNVVDVFNSAATLELNRLEILQYSIATAAYLGGWWAARQEIWIQIYVLFGQEVVAEGSLECVSAGCEARRLASAARFFVNPMTEALVNRGLVTVSFGLYLRTVFSWLHALDMGRFAAEVFEGSVFLSHFISWYGPAGEVVYAHEVCQLGETFIDLSPCPDMTPDLDLVEPAALQIPTPPECPASGTLRLLGNPGLHGTDVGTDAPLSLVGEPRFTLVDVGELVPLGVLEQDFELDCGVDPGSYLVFVEDEHGNRASIGIDLVAAAATMTLDPATIEMYAGESRLARASVRTSDGDPVTGLSITCADCADANLAVTQIAEPLPGEYDLRVGVQNTSAPLPSQPITLSAVLHAGAVVETPLMVAVHRLTGIELVPAASSIRLGETTTIAVVGQPEGIEVTGLNWTWSVQGDGALEPLNGSARNSVGWPQQTHSPGSPLSVRGIHAGSVALTARGGTTEPLEAVAELAVWADHLAVSGEYEGHCSGSGSQAGPATATFTFSHADLSHPRVTGEIAIEGSLPITEHIDVVVGVIYNELSGYTVRWQTGGLSSRFESETAEGPYELRYRATTVLGCHLTQKR